MKLRLLVVCFAAFLGQLISTKGADGVFLSPRLEKSATEMENDQLVMRLPLVATNAPPARGIILADNLPGMKLHQRSGGYLMVPDRSASRAPYRVYVLLEAPLDGELELRLVLNGQVFWNVEPDDQLPFHFPGRYASFPVELDENPMAVLRAAGVVFDVPEAFLFDVRLTELQRNQRAAISGSFPRSDVDKIRPVMKAMGVRQILDSLNADRSEWGDLLKEWPGLHPLQISGDKDRASARFSPKRGFQLEKRELRWMIVGG